MTAFKAKASKDTTLEDFFSSTFFLYTTWPVTTGGGDETSCSCCGCAVPRDTWLATTTTTQQRRRTCPLCGTASKNGIVAVADGYTHSLRASIAGDDGDGDGDEDSDTRKTPPEGRRRPTLLFKHGSLIYHVGLPPQKPVAAFSLSRQWFSVLGWFFGGDSGSENGTYLAQDHIAYVLGLELPETKILCKGKVLYPSSTMSPEDVSKQLLQESSSSFGGTAPAPRLLIMGTPHAQQLTDRPQTPTTMTSRLYQWIVRFLWWPYLLFESFLPRSLRLKRD